MPSATSFASRVIRIRTTVNPIKLETWLRPNSWDSPYITLKD